MIDYKNNVIENDINFYNCDYKDLIKLIPDKSVNAIITDIPYLISIKTNFGSMGKRGGNNNMDFGEWDKVENQGSTEELVEPMFKEGQRILKDNSNIVVFCSWQQLGKISDIMIANHVTPKRCLALYKKNPAPFNMDKMFVNDLEVGCWGVYNSKDKPTKWTFNSNKEMHGCVFETQVQNTEIHPTMKDINVIIELTELLTNKDDLVFDPFSGSGSEAIACKVLGRKFVGCELDEEYFKKAKGRINSNEVYVKKRVKKNNEFEGQMSILDFLNETGEKE